jgi:hypothetical protein
MIGDETLALHGILLGRVGRKALEAFGTVNATVVFDRTLEWRLGTGSAHG